MLRDSGSENGAGAAVGVLVGQRARARAAPEPAVVAVRVGAQLAEREQPADPARGVLAVDHAAVAPLVGEAGVGEDRRRVAGVAAGLLAERPGIDRGLAGQVEAVRVDDRHDDRPGPILQAVDARVLGVVERQVVRELQGALARRPLASVVDAHDREHRLAVGRVDVLGDLDAVDLAALVGLVGQRERLDAVRVVADELLERRLVLPQMPVGVVARGQRRGRPGRGVGLVGLRVLGGLRDDVRHADAVGQALAGELVGVGGAVRQDLDEVGSAVLGLIEAERVEQVLGRRRRRVDPHDRELVRRAAGRQRRGRDRQARGAGRARYAAGLDRQRAAARGEALGDLARVKAR